MRACARIICMRFCSIARCGTHVFVCAWPRVSGTCARAGVCGCVCARASHGTCAHVGMCLCVYVYGGAHTLHRSSISDERTSEMSTPFARRFPWASRFGGWGRESTIDSLQQKGLHRRRIVGRSDGTVNKNKSKRFCIAWESEPGESSFQTGRPHRRPNPWRRMQNFAQPPGVTGHGALRT